MGRLHDPDTVLQIRQDPDQTAARARSTHGAMNAVKRQAAKRQEQVRAAAKLPEHQRVEALQQLFVTFSKAANDGESKAKAEESKAGAAEKALATAQEELAKVSAKSDQLETLLTQLQDRHAQCAQARADLIDAEEAERLELSERFRKTIEEVNVGIDAQGSGRAGLLKENERLHSSVLALATKYEASEGEHQATMRVVGTTKAALEAEVEGVERELAALATEEETLKERGTQIAADDAAVKDELAAFARSFEEVQAELTASNGAFAEHKQRLAAATERLKSAERAHAQLSAQKAEQARLLKPLRAAIKDAEAGAARAREQRAKVAALCDMLRSELDAPGGEDGGAAAPEEAGDPAKAASAPTGGD